MSSRRWASRVVVAVLAVLIVSAGHGARATFPGEPGLIAFVRQGRDGGIFTMEPTGANLTRLTLDSDGGPQWSPDGTRIVFSRYDWGRSFLWLMDADGTNQMPLANIEGFQPAWSPDGKQIVFGAGERFRSTEIYVVNVDGSGQRQLTDDDEPDGSPAWSPDGGKILYTHGHPHSDLYLMDADGTNQTRLTRNPTGDYGGDWSPDGSTIVFHSRRHGNWDLYTIRPDGTEPRRITDGPATEWAPVWSPDGTRIAYTLSNYRTGSQDIAVLNLTNSVVVRYVTGSSDLGPDWQAV